MKKSNQSRSEINHHLLGCLETALLMRSGIARFSSTREAMIQSFAIPVLLLPLTILTVLTAHPHDDLTTSTSHLLIAIYTLRVFVYLGLFLGFVYTMAKTMDRMQDFYRFATANNWLAIPAAAALLPLLGLFLGGHYDWAEIYPLMVFVTLYSYVYTGFMAMHTFRLPWEMGGFIAIAGMAIHQTSLDALKWAAVQTIYLVS
jgi:hypothetical protein